MSTGLKKKWYQSAFSSPYFFLFVLYFYSAYLFSLYNHKAPILCFMHDIIIFPIIGIFSAFVKKRIPFLWLLLFCIIDILIISERNIKIFCFKYILSLFGAGSCILILFLYKKNKCNFTRELKYKVYKFFNSEAFIKKRNFICAFLFFVYMIFLSIIFVITNTEISTDIKVKIYSILIFIAGIILGYITQRIPIIIIIFSLVIVFIIPVKILISYFGFSFEFFSVFSAMLLPMFYVIISGSYVGFCFFKYFSQYTKFKKFSLLDFFTKIYDRKRMN